MLFASFQEAGVSSKCSKLFSVSFGIIIFIISLLRTSSLRLRNESGKIKSCYLTFFETCFYVIVPIYICALSARIICSPYYSSWHFLYIALTRRSYIKNSLGDIISFNLVTLLFHSTLTLQGEIILKS